MSSAHQQETSQRKSIRAASTSVLLVFVTDLSISFVTIAATFFLLNRLFPSMARGWSNWDAFSHKALMGLLAFEGLHHTFAAILIQRWIQRAGSKQYEASAIATDVTTASSQASTSQSIQSPIDPTRKALIKPEDRSLLSRPTVAWPTVVLALVSISGWAVCMHKGSTGEMSVPWALAGGTLCTFVAFTPMHDAVHYAVSPRHRWLNDAVGFLASLPFVAGFPLFRLIHLMHHRNCNDDGSAPDGSSLDPDSWAGDGPLWQLPCRWATVFLYYRVYLRRLALWESNRKYKRLHYTYAVMIPALTAAAFWWEPMLAIMWTTSMILASTYLMYVFDYLPHRPHIVPYKIDPYRSTSVIVELYDGFLTIPLLSQNMHNIHHLFPYVPFYKYGAIWESCRQELIQLGTRTVPWVIWGEHAAYFDESKPK